MLLLHGRKSPTYTTSRSTSNGGNMSGKILIDIRQSGKTTDLILMSAETGYPIVCVNQRAVESVLERAKELKQFGYNIPDDIPTPTTVAEMRAGVKRGDSKYGHVLVDDVHVFLHEALAEYLNTQTVEGCTICNSSEDWW